MIADATPPRLEAFSAHRLVLAMTVAPRSKPPELTVSVASRPETSVEIATPPDDTISLPLVPTVVETADPPDDHEDAAIAADADQGCANRARYRSRSRRLLTDTLPIPEITAPETTPPAETFSTALTGAAALAALDERRDLTLAPKPTLSLTAIRQRRIERVAARDHQCSGTRSSRRCADAEDRCTARRHGDDAAAVDEVTALSTPPDDTVSEPPLSTVEARPPSRLPASSTVTSLAIPPGHADDDRRARAERGV